MESNHKYLITAAEITVFFAIGPISLAPDRVQPSSSNPAKIEAGSAENICLEFSRTQCPYCGCPYLYRHRETAGEDNDSVIVFAHACPNNSRSGGKAAEGGKDRKAPLFVDVIMPGYNSRN